MENKETENHQMSENMKTFFLKLLELKKYVNMFIEDIQLAKENGKNHTQQELEAMIQFVYKNLDSIIKEKE